MHSVWLIMAFTVLALFGAIAILPTLHKTTRTQFSTWPVSFWSLETLRTFGKAPLIFTLISANILSGWAWGSAVSWLLITLIFGLLLLPLTDYGFDKFDTRRPSNNWAHKITHSLFLIASLSILTKIVVGLVMVIPEIGATAMLFIILMALNRYSGKASLLLLTFGLICGAILSANISLTIDGEAWLFELLLSSSALACLFSLSVNRSSRTSLGILSGVGALIISLVFTTVGLLFSGELSPLNTPREPALPLICLALLLPGLLPGVERYGRSKAKFATIGNTITSSHLLVFIVGMVIVISIISMSSSFVNSFSNPPLSSAVEELVSTTLSGNLYSDSFAPETIMVSMIEQLLNALPIDDAYIQISKYVVILSLILGIVQLAIKQLETVLGISRSIFKPRSALNKPTNPIVPWALSGAIIAALMLAPALSLWLACSCSFAILIVHEFCTRSLKLSDTRPATRVYLSLSLILIVSLAFQLTYLMVSSGLQNQFGVTGIVFLLLMLFMLQLAPQSLNLANKLKKAQSSSLEELKNL
jgi:hypothetical protein